MKSTFVRNDDLSLDMPLDSNVFRVPPGYNAPQQVRMPLFLHFHLMYCSVNQATVGFLLSPKFQFFPPFQGGFSGFLISDSEAYFLMIKGSYNTRGL